MVEEVGGRTRVANRKKDEAFGTSRAETVGKAGGM